MRGPMVCKGYVDEAQTAEAFDEEGWFRTGDVGHLRPDGHLVITGRIKDIIIRKGENVSAKEVEDLLYTHPRVGAVAVIGLPDPSTGERVCAVVEPRPEASASRSTSCAGSAERPASWPRRSPSSSRSSSGFLETRPSTRS